LSNPETHGLMIFRPDIQTIRGGKMNS